MKNKRYLLLGRKAMTNLDRELKSRDIILLTKVHLVKAMIFPVVMYGCESWTIKKAEHQRIDAFKLWCWRRLLRVPLDSKEIKPSNCKGNQSWIFIGRTDAEAPVYFSHLIQRADSEKDPDAGKVWGQKEKGMAEDEMIGWHHWLDGRGFGWTPGVGDGQGGVACCSSWGSQRLRYNWVTELNWIELDWVLPFQIQMLKPYCPINCFWGQGL